MALNAPRGRAAGEGEAEGEGAEEDEGEDEGEGEGEDEDEDEGGVEGEDEKCAKPTRCTGRLCVRMKREEAEAAVERLTE